MGKGLFGKLLDAVAPETPNSGTTDTGDPVDLLAGFDLTGTDVSDPQLWADLEGKLGKASADPEEPRKKSSLGELRDVANSRMGTKRVSL